METSNNLILATPIQQRHLAEYHLYSDQETGCLSSPILPVTGESNKGVTLSFKKECPYQCWSISKGKNKRLFNQLFS